MDHDLPSYYDLRPLALLRDGWRMVVPHYFTILIAFIALGLTHGLLLRFAVMGAPALFLINATFSSGICWFLLQVYQGHKPTLAAFIEPMQRKPVDVLVLQLIAGILVFLGFVCLALPGFYLAVSFWMGLPLVLLTDATPVQALKRSHALVLPQVGDFLLVALVFLVINTVALLPLGLGLLFTLPASCGATTLVVARVLRLPPHWQG